MQPAGRLAGVAVLVLLTGLTACQPAAPSAIPGSSATSSGPSPTPTPFIKPSIGPNHTTAPATSNPQLGHILITLEPFATVPGSPLAIAAPDDGTGRLFVVDQAGLIWIVDRNGSTRPDALVDLRSLLRSGGEQGLLGLALHPTFPTDPRAFVNYTNPDGDSIVASLSLDPSNPDRLEPASRKQLLFVDQPYTTTTAARSCSGRTASCTSRSATAAAAAIRRATVRTSARCSARSCASTSTQTGRPGRTRSRPTIRSSAGGGAHPRSGHYGLRNPWRITFDRATGDLWIGDVGPGRLGGGRRRAQRRRAAGTTAGTHGRRACYEGGTAPRELALPVAEYAHEGGCAIIGGYVYRGDRYPFLVGTYLMADYCTGTIFAIDAASNGLRSRSSSGRARARSPRSARTPTASCTSRTSVATSPVWSRPSAEPWCGVRAGLDLERVGLLGVDPELREALCGALRRDGPARASAESAAAAMLGGSISNQARSESRVSLRPKPSVPSVTNGASIHGPGPAAPSSNRSRR